MKSIRDGLAVMLMAGGALLAAAPVFPMASATDDASAAALPPPGPPDAPGAGHADWGHSEWGHGHGGGAEHLFSKLGLTAEQKASIKAIMTAARPQMQGMREQMRANHLKMMQTKPDDPNYGNVVAEVSQSNAALAAQHTSQAAELRAQMFAVLTPAQRTQLAALEAQRAEHPHSGPWGAHGAGAAAASPAAPPAP